MLIASPIAGAYADRHGSRALAASGMLVTAVGLAGMTIARSVGTAVLGRRRAGSSSSASGSGLFN